MRSRRLADLEASVLIALEATLSLTPSGMRVLLLKTKKKAAERSEDARCGPPAAK